MYELHIYDRTGFFADSSHDEYEDVRAVVVDSVKNFLLKPEYNVVFEPDFNLVQVWDDESLVLEYKWFKEG